MYCILSVILPQYPFEVRAAGWLFLLLGIFITASISFSGFLKSKLLPWFLFFYHMGLAIFYWYYSLSHVADAMGYYQSIGKTTRLRAGTEFIEYLMNRLDSLFFAGYFDYYLLFHIFGFVGLCLLIRIFQELQFFPVSKYTNYLNWIVVFFPGINFWTTAPGKDSLIFFAIMLSSWGLIQFPERIIAIVLGVILIYLIRPHIAGFFMASIVLSMFWGSGIRLRWKIVGTTVFFITFIMLLPFIQDFVGLKELSLESVGTYLQKRQSLYLEYESSVNIQKYSIFLKILTFLYRPFFFDAKSFLWVVTSFEHLAYVILTILLFSRSFIASLQKYHYNFYIRFHFFFFAMGVFFFSMSITNLGLALRQKTMLMPSFLILVVMTYAIRPYNATWKTRMSMEKIPTQGELPI